MFCLFMCLQWSDPPVGLGPNHTCIICLQLLLLHVLLLLLLVHVSRVSLLMPLLLFLYVWSMPSLLPSLSRIEFRTTR